MRDMTKWLGDGGMPLIGQLGASFDHYGEGWVTATWTPTELAGNTRAIVQAGVVAVLLDAAMNFALNAALDGGDRSKATLEMKTETMRASKVGDVLHVRGEVVRLTRSFAWTEGWVRQVTPDGELAARSTGTFAVHRA